MTPMAYGTYAQVCIQDGCAHVACEAGTPLFPDLGGGDLRTLTEIVLSILQVVNHELLLSGWPGGWGPQAGNA